MFVTVALCVCFVVVFIQMNKHSDLLLLCGFLSQPGEFASFITSNKLNWVKTKKVSVDIVNHPILNRTPTCLSHFLKMLLLMIQTCIPESWTCTSHVNVSQKKSHVKVQRFNWFQQSCLLFCHMSSLFVIRFNKG